MTLVDLPGITRVPVGDQPMDIEQRIKEMILTFIKEPTCIILAVTPANSDLSNSDALQLARSVDPEGLRTIGVLTKLDIMDRGTSAGAILRNQGAIPLKMGYVGVVCRSQADINRNATINEAWRQEASFFAASTDYRDVAHQCGTPNLAKKLNIVLVDHIRSIMPSLRRRMQEMHDDKSQELALLGDSSTLQTKSAKGAFLLRLLCDYSDRLGAMLDGRHVEMPTNGLSGGARIRYVFNHVYGKALKDLSPLRLISDEEISTVIKNGAGVCGNLLVPQEPFEVLVRRSVSQLLPPSLQCKESVHEELLKISEQACPKEASRFPSLQRSLAHSVMEFIRQGSDPSEVMIRHLVECELDHINTDHPEFIGGRGAIRAAMNDRAMRVVGGGGMVNPHHNPTLMESPGKDGGAGAGHVKSSPSIATIHHNNDSNGVRAHSMATLGGGGGGGLGLKSLGQPSPGMNHHMSSDELLLSRTRTRRKSDDGIIPLSQSSSQAHHGARSSKTNHFSSQPHYPSPGGGAGGGQEGQGGSWFSWFGQGQGQGQGRLDSQLHQGVNHGNSPFSLNRVPTSPAGGLLGGLLRTEQEELEVDVIRKLVDSYFGVVRKSLQDQVPKAIMHFMVNNTKRGLQQHLIQQLYRDDVIDELLSERDDIVAQRRACKESLAALQESLQALEAIPAQLVQLSNGGEVKNQLTGPPLVREQLAVPSSGSSHPPPPPRDPTRNV